MACVAIGFTNLDQPGELGFPLAVAVFGINCLDGSMRFGTVAFEKSFTAGLLRCDVFAACLVFHMSFSTSD